LKSKKANCIFSYNDFIYVVNFETMTMWVCFDEDEEDPISTVEIKRVSTNRWDYRTINADMEFLVDTDREFQTTLEDKYSIYLNQLIMEKNARSSQNRNMAP